MPVLVAVEQFKAKTVPEGMSTVLVSIHDCPPTLNAKLAVPLEDGVPAMLKVKLPAPLAKLPDVKEAVKPVTPVEVIVCVV